MEESYAGFLKTKRSVDERAINRRVWEAAVRFLHRQSDGWRAVRVLEVGAGVGDTARRLLAAETAPELEYTLVDLHPEHVEAARTRLLHWACEAEFTVSSTDRGLVLEREDRVIRLVMEVADLYDFTRRARGGQGWDLVIGQALLDLLNLSRALPSLFSVLRPEGAFYFPITFDGVTRFLPAVDADLDARIERLYHASMDCGEEGGSLTGSQLFTAIPAAGASIRKVGSSDWIVFPRGNGRYMNEEQGFLEHLLGFLQHELEDHPNLDAAAFRQWMDTRREQLREGKLSCIVHQLDFFGVVL